MSKIISYLIFGLMMCPKVSFSQTATEAFRFSLSDPSGTARNLGTGNSMFAIGPDFSAIGLNPSGLGGYGKSEFLITSGISLNNFSAAFTSDITNESTGAFKKITLPNVGFIIHNRPQGSGWISSNWAVGFNRVADFNRKLEYAGNTLGSIAESWRENATGLFPDKLNGFEEGLAYTSGAIYDLEEDNIYETDYDADNLYALFKQDSSRITGGKTELFIAYGADLNHKLLIGFSVGLPIVNYTETRLYEEIDEAADGVPFFNELKYTSYVNSTGYGFNGKIGVTVKPTEFLNIAVAFQSPTRLNMSDNFNTTLSYDYTDENNDGPIRSESPFGSFQYALRTPWSASGGIGIIAGKSGFVAVHGKLTDYGSMKYKYSVRGNGDEYEQIERKVNDEIRTIYGKALQFNVGGELVLNTFRVRGGATLQQSAFNNDNSFDPAYHAGLGYRGENFYVDLGYKLSKEEEGFLPYETIAAPQPLVISNQTEHQIAATLGFKF